MVTKYCCCIENRTGAQLIAIWQLISAVLNLWPILKHFWYANDKSGVLSAYILPIVTLILLIVSAFLLFQGARKNIPQYILFWIVLAVVILVLFAIQGWYQLRTEAWIPYVVYIVLGIWFILVGHGAREEAKLFGSPGMTV